MKVDYIIVGQGLCGTFLSWNLISKGKRVIVIDEENPFSATRVASGVINPVTGRRIVRTWRIEELLPFAWQAYQTFEKELNCKLIRECNILDFHPTLQMKEAFEKRLPQEPEYLSQPINEDQWKTCFNFHYGIGEVKPCLLIDLVTMLGKWRKRLSDLESLYNERFKWQNCMITNDKVAYDNITADKIIFCDGVQGFDNPYFKNLPYTKMKGEALIVEINQLPTSNIYKHGLNIVPWKDNLFWVGSSYEWQFETDGPTELFRKKSEQQLDNFLKLPYAIVDHLAAVRPANLERRPFVGLHPHHKTVGVFNGMGTKGCSLAPFFAKQFADNLLNGGEIYADADVKRFSKVLLREIDTAE